MTYETTWFCSITGAVFLSRVLPDATNAVIGTVFLLIAAVPPRHRRARPMTWRPETCAVCAWLGRLEMEDREVKTDFRNLSLALSPVPLAQAMRQYVEGPIGAALRQQLAAEHGENALERIDFDGIAAMTQARVHRYQRSAAARCVA